MTRDEMESEFLTNFAGLEDYYSVRMTRTASSLYSCSFDYWSGRDEDYRTCGHGVGESPAVASALAYADWVQRGKIDSPW